MKSQIQKGAKMNHTEKFIKSGAVFLALSLLAPFSANAANVAAPSQSDTGTDFFDKLPPSITDRIIPRGREAESTAAAGSYNWYCCHTSGGAIPPCPTEMSFITDVGGVYIGNTEEKVIYLTFDAGYENGNIEKTLDTLKDEGVGGAFFVLKNLAKQNPELIRRMSNEGHLICNHTAHHRDMTAFHDIDAIRAELDELNSACADSANVECAPFYRPPEGKFSRENLEMISSLGYTTVFWSFAYADWDNNAQPSPESAKKKILDGTHNGMILLLHPTSSTNAEILGDLIRTWKADGYRFGSLTELSKQSL